MARNSSISSFKNLPKAFLLAVSVIMVLYSAEMFMLPINFFTFRVWEALVVKKFLPGIFYPNMEISMTEVGDLGNHTKFAVKKEVKWETDRYGYRKRNVSDDECRIVILGDSNIIGSGLTQKDILSEVLERRLKTGVYPFASLMRHPIVNSFLETERFVKNPPDTVILALIERNIRKLPELNLKKSGLMRKSGIEKHWESFLDDHQDFAVLLDRICKNNMGHYIKNRIDALPTYLLTKLTKREYMPAGVMQSTKNDGILFLQETVEGMAVKEEAPLEEISQIIMAYDRIFKKRNIRFIFLPIPNKENIYYEDLPIRNKTKPEFLGKLISILRNNGINVIDTQKAFDEAFHQKGILLYQTDDSHWNANGVRLTASLIKELLHKNR